VIVLVIVLVVVRCEFWWASQPFLYVAATLVVSPLILSSYPYVSPATSTVVSGISSVYGQCEVGISKSCY
jgi:hypothetical protein